MDDIVCGAYAASVHNITAYGKTSMLTGVFYGPELYSCGCYNPHHPRHRPLPKTLDVDAECAVYAVWVEYADVARDVARYVRHGARCGRLKKRHSSMGSSAAKHLNKLVQRLGGYCERVRLVRQLQVVDDRWRVDAPELYHKNVDELRAMIDGHPSAQTFFV
ncbi:hypothetical protein CYMTET_37348 [Cymbomonas tetramitiformis]|uniref:Uncharacterized protein n=1 Tax=Cymbomonas tetramitiformis TaxID=36881 RepID=A0AAE0CFM6_9CHLO|nr:hypothetical protein CYMTET_46605 [Cymbomonas tetramitiformis]KAK3253349.1 hypothetical protein CYMTET_37348 [Cymbomonas tetramitiformis]